MGAVSQSMKVLGSIAVLVIGLSLLWKVPSWEQKSVAREDVSGLSDLSGNLPQFDRRQFFATH